MMLDLNAVGQALSSPIRTALLAMAPNETLGEAADRLGVSPSTLSHHVSVLEEAGLVVVDKVGTRKYLRPRLRTLEIRLIPAAPGEVTDRAAFTRRVEVERARAPRERLVG